MPAGPAPTIAKSISCEGQCFQMPASLASSCSEGLTSTRPSLHSMTGMVRGGPSAARTVRPLFAFRIEPGKGDEVLVEELADRVRVAASAGPTTRNPSTPNWASSSRRRVKAVISFSPRLGTRFSKARSWLPGTQRPAFGPAPRRSQSPDGRSAGRCRRQTGPARERR